jgi:hypothetical protein
MLVSAFVSARCAFATLRSWVPAFAGMTRFCLCAGVIAVFTLGTVRHAIARIPTPTLAHIKSIGIIASVGDTCMFERVPASGFEWLAPPLAGFLEISDWGIDDGVTAEITKRLSARYRIQGIAIEHQDFDNWTWDSLRKFIRELPVPEVPVDVYLLVLRDWRADEIGYGAHQVGGLGLYRRDLVGGNERLGAFASYRLVLMDAENGNILASRSALMPDGSLPWLPASRALWPRTQNDLSDAQHRELQDDFLKLIDATLPDALGRIGLSP